MNPAQDDTEMLRRAVAGDGTALKLLLLESHTRFCDYVGCRIPADLRPRLDAEDILQETYAQVFRHVTRFEPRGPDSFPRWVLTIALRRLRNAISRRRAAKRGGGEPTAGAGRGTREDSCVALLDLLAAPGRTPSRCVARQEAVQAVEDALATLPDHYRQAIALVYLEGRPVATAAAEMGRTDRAIHGLCRRGLKLLRDQLGSVSGFLSSTE